MRLRLAVAVLSALVLLPAIPTVPASPANAPGPLVVSELLPVPDATKGQREFVEVWNPTDAPVALSGWKLRDAPTTSGSYNEFTFSSGSLPPKARIVVWSNGSADARGPSWSTSASKTVWNDAGDAVSLLDPTGTVADWFAYGNAAMPPPAGFETQAKPAAPSKGSSLGWDGTSWIVGVPTPALAPGQVGGSAGATVLNIAPTVALSGLPASTKPGKTYAVTLTLGDANGASDIVAWTLTSAGATVAQGASAQTPALNVTAPSAAGTWVVEATVTDAGGLSGHAAATIPVLDALLTLSLPDGVLRFPDLSPGDHDVAARDWATLRNNGTEAATPLLDVSPFSNGAAEIPVEGNLWIGLDTGNGTVQWLAYEGPMTELPVLAPAASLQMTLRLAAVPLPLPAGSYGTTFAVVAA